MKRIVFILISAVLVAHAWAQSAAQADELFQQQNYEEAMLTYEKLLQRQPKSQLYLYRYARCAQETGDKQKAIEYFLRAGDKYALRNFYLGELYFDDYQFSLAAECYEYFMKQVDDSNERYEYSEQRRQQALRCARYLKRVENIIVIDSTLVGKDDFLRVYNLSAEAGSLKQEGGIVTYTNQRGERQITSVGDSIKQDLQMCYIMDAQPADCDSLSMLNTAAVEAFPFMLADGVTLYFASNRDDGLGGLDIYITQYSSNSNQWLQPENIGMPFNSPYNDYMLAIDEQNNIGYFATDRRAAADSVVVYTFRVKTEKSYLKTADTQEQRLVAQLLSYRREAGEEIQVEHNTPKPTNSLQTQTIHFIINDTIVYTSLSDFKSIDARQMYEQYLDLKTNAEEEQQALDEYRYRYSEADADERRQIAPVIRTLEVSCRQFREQQKTALNQVRLVELNFYQN